MVKGRLYSTAGTRRAVVALDAATGELKWTYSLDEGPRGAAAPRQLSGRGLSYWSDGKEERILYVTPGYRLIALDAATGRPVPGFGTDGIVDLKQNFDQDLDLVKAAVGLHATPMVANDVVIVGAAFETGANPKSKVNVKGYVRGFDVRTGKRLWIFRTIPSPGEFGNNTWRQDSWAYTGNTGVWAQISVDPELGLAYLPVELPTHDYYGGARPGDNLFAESLVAVDLRTGERKWHFQLVHHGVWDMDIPCAPILADVMIDGRLRKIVAQPTKQAFLYVFDRVTGEPIWPIVEQPVPKGDVPGEHYSPTQPIPVQAAGLRPAGLRGGRPHRLHARAAQGGRSGDRALPHRAEVHAAFAQPQGGADRHADDGRPGRRDQLARRLVRSRDRHPLRGVRKLAAADGAGAATARRVGPAVSPGHRAVWCAAIRRLGVGHRRSRRRRSRTHGAGAAAGEAAVQPDQRHRSHQRRDPLAGAARRDAGLGEEPRRAEGARPAADRPPRQQRRHARDQDAGHRRRRQLRPDAVGHARGDAARLRQGQRQGGGGVPAAGAADRLADDLHAERPAVPGHRRQRSRLQRRAAGAAGPGAGGATGRAHRPAPTTAWSSRR